MYPWDERRRHSEEACAELLSDLIPDPPGLLGDLVPGDMEPEVVIELLGRALWDIFSHNHTVVDSEGAAYDLGSFRGSGDFIAHVLNERYPSLEQRYTYLDFYMGGAPAGGGADLTPIHRWIFSHLRTVKCDWMYSFPRLHVIDFGGLVPKRDDELGYDPSEAIRAELEERERREEVDALSSQLDMMYDEAVRRARHAPLPDTVAAYREVFGVLPDGWPHPDM